MPLLVNWTVVGEPSSGRLDAMLGAADPLCDWLRRHFGHESVPCWSVSVEVVPQAQLPVSWYEEDTLLGDFLRTIRELASKPEEPIVAALPTEHPLADACEQLAQLPDEETRAETLHRAAELGARLLAGKEPV
jgi:hypothetical protein